MTVRGAAKNPLPRPWPVSIDTIAGIARLMTSSSSAGAAGLFAVGVREVGGGVEALGASGLSAIALGDSGAKADALGAAGLSAIALGDSAKADALGATSLG